LTLPLLAGCTSTRTLGDVRRYQFFNALLMAWVLGLALIWRWWSRRRDPPRRDVDGRSRS
jgi:hypothetical protein